MVNMLLGALYDRPTLFDRPDTQALTENDFSDTMQKIAYSIMYNLYSIGHSTFSDGAIKAYIQGRPQLSNFFNSEIKIEDHTVKQGEFFFGRLAETGDAEAFEPAFNMTKKMTLLRTLEQHGVNVKQFYDWDTPNRDLLQSQQEWLDNTSLSDIASEISDSIQVLIDGATSNARTKSIQVAEGLEDLLSSFKEAPDYGSPSPIQLMDTITRGNRLGKFYLFSAPTGAGKTRIMMSMAVNSAIDKRYNQKKQQWEDNGNKIPTLLISTELDETECQTMVLAFMTGIQEEKILDGRFDADEERILKEAIKILEGTPLYFEIITDFGITEIEATMRKYYRENDVEQFYFDYIHVSMKLLQEISSISNGTKLREDQILFMLATKLKDIANTLGVFIMSGTQLNGDWQEGELNQNLLRGSKAISDRLDIGIVATRVRPIDEPFVDQFVSAGYMKPNYIMSFYKVRRGKYAGTKLWCHVDLGTCTCQGLFLTDSNNIPIGVDAKTIKVKKKAEKVAERRNNFTVDSLKSGF